DPLRGGQTQHQEYEEEDQEEQREELGDRERRAGDSRESQKCGDHPDEEKRQSQFEHGQVLRELRNCENRAAKTVGRLAARTYDRPAMARVPEVPTIAPRRFLLARVPDTPRWVETRGMLLSGRCRILWTSASRDAFAIRSDPGSLVCCFGPV